MNRMEKPNKPYVSKARKRLGIVSLILDAVYVILGFSFYHYEKLPSFYQSILSHVWIGLMAAALVVALIGIFASKEYELFRSSMFETVILIAQGVWLGASGGMMLVKNQQAPFPMYFLIGLFCILAVGLFIQIDAIWFRSIMHFMMKDSADMVEIETPAKLKKTPSPQAAVVRQGTVTLDTSHLRRSTMRRQTQMQPRVQVIDQNEARNAVKQAQAKARAKQALAEDFEKRSRSASRTSSPSARRQTAQPRKAVVNVTAQSQPRQKREPLFIEPQKESSAHPSKHTRSAGPQRSQVQANSAKRRVSTQPRVRVQQPENQRTATPRPTHHTQPARHAQPAALADATTKWEPKKVRQAEEAAQRAAKLRELKARKAAMRTRTPSSTPADSAASSTESPQWATQRKRRPKPHHYTKSATHLFIRDDDQE